MGPLSAEVVCSILETAFHCLLCVRNVYPPESFSRVRRFGQFVWQSNSKALSAYLKEVCASLVEPLRRGLLGAVCLRLQRETGEAAEVYTFGFGAAAAEKRADTRAPQRAPPPPHAADAAAAVLDYEATESIQNFLARAQLISCWLPQQQQQQQLQQLQQQELVSFSVCAHALEEVAGLADVAAASTTPAAAAAAAAVGELSNPESRSAAQRFLCQWRRPLLARRGCCEGDSCGLQGEGLLSLPCTAIRAADNTLLTLAVCVSPPQQQQQEHEQQQLLQHQQQLEMNMENSQDLAESDLADLDFD
ncbi:hypothetical protein Efla_004219 [Eimeria flavescens]